MNRFLPQSDETAKWIQVCAADLYERLKNTDPDSMGMPDHCLWYYKESHSKRLFFSIETSANLLYGAIKLANKPVAELVVMDYGAGVGTLFLLAKMIGCGTVVYNDHLEDWKLSAQLVASASGIIIDHYIVGDIESSVDKLDQIGLQCDIITSRNVVEHIYDLKKFYDTLYHRQPNAIVYSSTTANAANPAAVVKHRMWHKKWEKAYRGKRLSHIRREFPEIPENVAAKLAFATRGLANADIDKVVQEFRMTGTMPSPSVHRSNTCDPENGVWAEHLLNANEYRGLIDENHYDVVIKAGFWDTHYNKTYKNIAGKIMNRLITNGFLAVTMAPFIYVIAKPKTKRT